MAERREKDAPATSFDAQIVLRPRSLDETLDLALVYIRTSLRPFIKLALILVGFAMLLVGLVGFSFQLTFDQAAALAVFISPVLERVVTVYTGRHLFRNEPRIGQAIAAVLKRLPFALFSALVITLPWTMILWTEGDDRAVLAIGVMLGSFWPFILASHVYLGEVAHLEQLPAARAAQRSRALILFRYGRALGLVIFSAIIRVGIALLVELVIEFVLGFLLQFGEISSLISHWPAVVGYLIAGQYIALVRLFDYVDCRTRREGWDIQVRFNAIAQKERQAEAHRLAA